MPRQMPMCEDSALILAIAKAAAADASVREVAAKPAVAAELRAFARAAEERLG